MLDEIPDLTPELEWMLQSNQVSDTLVAEALVDEYYPKLILLAEIILEDSRSAQFMAIETIFQSIQDRDVYWSDQSTSILIYTKSVKVLHQLTKKTGIQRILSSQLPHLHPRFRGRTVEPVGNPVAEKLSYLDKLDFKDRATLFFHVIERFNCEQISILLKEERSKTEKRLKLVRNLIKHDMDGGENEESEILRLEDSFRAKAPTLDTSTEELEKVVREILDKININIAHKRKQGMMGKISVGAGVLIAVIGLFWLTNLSASRETPLPLIPERVIITQIIRVPIYVTETPVPHNTPTQLNMASNSNEIKIALQQSATYWDRVWLDGITIQYGTPGEVVAPLIRRDQVWVAQPYDSLIITGFPEQGADQVWLSKAGKVFDVNPRIGAPVLYDFHTDHLPVYSGFADFIFPDPDLIASNTYQPIAEEQLAGRDALVVEEFNSTGAKTSHLWIDMIVGNILRRIRFAVDESTVTQDRILLSIAYDVEMPNRLFNRNHLLTNFVADHLGRSESSTSSSREELALITKDTLNRHLSPPPIFEAAHAEFLFRWKYPQLSTHFKSQPDIIYQGYRNLKEES